MIHCLLEISCLLVARVSSEVPKHDIKIPGKNTPLSLKNSSDFCDPFFLPCLSVANDFPQLLTYVEKTQHVIQRHFKLREQTLVYPLSPDPESYQEALGRVSHFSATFQVTWIL